MSENSGGCFGTLVAVAIGAFCLSGWVTHIVVCFQENRWGFLIAGALFIPIGIIHGAGRWFDLW